MTDREGERSCFKLGKTIQPSSMYLSAALAITFLAELDSFSVLKQGIPDWRFAFRFPPARDLYAPQPADAEKNRCQRWLVSFSFWHVDTYAFIQNVSVGQTSIRTMEPFFNDHPKNKKIKFNSFYCFNISGFLRSFSKAVPLYLKDKSKVWGDFWHDFRLSSLRTMI